MLADLLRCAWCRLFGHAARWMPVDRAPYVLAGQPVLGVQLQCPRCGVRKVKFYEARDVP